MGRSLVFGVGITDSKASHSCPYYSRWKGVLRRCYGKPRRLPDTYKGCTVADEWIYFSAFRDWMARQPWQGFQIDKDILRPWEKRYSPETSVFVPNWINTLMIDGAARDCSLPTGVYLNKGRYLARVHDGLGARLYVGLFDDPHTAHVAWAQAKAEIIRSAVDRYRLTDRYDERVCTALLEKAVALGSINNIGKTTETNY